MACSLSPQVNAGWELYDDFNDSFLDPEKWEFPSGTQNFIEASGYLTIRNTTSGTVSSVVRSRLQENDIIKGVRAYFYLSEGCDFEGEVSTDSMQTGMVTRGLTNTLGGFSHDYIHAQTYLFIDNTAEDYESNLITTHILSSLHDGQPTDGQLTSINSVLESVHRQYNHKYTGEWFQLTADFSEDSEMRTTASWSSKAAIYHDPSLVFIEKNETNPQVPGAGKFDLYAFINPIQGAFTTCEVYIDHVEVLRKATAHISLPQQPPGTLLQRVN
ncbi:MAG: hypothetical protein AB2662_08610 [Candidatus Thiodiazotropha sp.]